MLFKNKRKHSELQQENITHINNEYTNEEKLKKKKITIQKIKARRRMGFILLFGVILLLPLTYRLVDSVSQVRDLDTQIVKATEEKRTIEDKNQWLNVQVGLLQDDDYIAKLARSRYYFSKENEIIFSLPEDNQSKAANKVE